MLHELGWQFQLFDFISGEKEAKNNPPIITGTGFTVRCMFFGCVFAGDSQPMDVCSIYHNGIFLRYSVSLLGYGFYGDLLADSERNRWLGPARYDLSGMRPLVF